MADSPLQTTDREHRKNYNEAEVTLAPLSSFNLQLHSAQPRRRNILFVTPELDDLVKTGGLGEVAAALPRALAGLHDARVLLPGYREVLDSGHPIRVVGALSGHAALPPCKLGRIDFDDGLIVYLLLCPELYERTGTPYTDDKGRDWPDNHIRFARLGMAAAEIAAGNSGIDWRPDLVHAHDWPAALAPAYMRWRGQTCPSVFTIHNLAYQGLYSLACRPELGIPAAACQPEGMEFHGELSFIKAGIAYASRITTVSATYAREITTAELGCGLEGLLKSKARQGLLSGIRNGIDESWDPVSDPHLLDHFSCTDWQGKALNAAYVRQRFELQPSAGPLFAVVSRLVQQKGLDLTLAVAANIVAAGGQIAITGCGEPLIEECMRQLSRRFPGQIGVHIGFDETDARRLFAGSDFLLMPSRYEPCGLSQMYAQRFAALPIAHRTGGLADSIEDGISGFLFNQANVDSYWQAIERALKVFAHPPLLHAMRCRAMASRFFWRQAIGPYADLYQKLLERRRKVRLPA
jgi:starch synthase